MKLRFCPTCFVFPSILTWQPVWATISGLQLFVVPAVTGGGPSAPGWGPSSSAAAGGLAVEGGLQLQAGGLHHQQQLGGLAVVGGLQLQAGGLHQQEEGHRGAGPCSTDLPG